MAKYINIELPLYGLNDFFLLSDIVITHYWPFINHWEVAALVLVNKNISNVILNPPSLESNSPYQLWQHLAKLKFIPKAISYNNNISNNSNSESNVSNSSNSGNNISVFYDWWFKKDLLEIYGGNSLSMFMLKPYLRMDGVYSQHKITVSYLGYFFPFFALSYFFLYL